MLTPYYQDGSATIYHGDALRVLDQLNVEADVIIADPPYSSGGRTAGERTRSTTAKYVTSDAKRKLPDFTGDTRDQHSHAHWCALWLAACLRISKPGGICFVWSDWRQLAATTDALQAGGWTWRGVVVWQKPGVRPMRGRFRYDTEYAVWGSNGDMPVHRKVYPSSVVTASPPRKREHIAQKPLEAYKHLLTIAPEDSLVVDPFTGTGSAVIASLEGGHRAVGVELDRRYCEIAARRVREVSLNSVITG